MKIIDLTQPLYDNMPVYPGDPEVKIKQALTLEKDGWNMNVISLPTHIATHVNVPVHAVKSGKTLDDYLIDAFCGKSVVYQIQTTINDDTGLLFEDATIKKETVQEILKVKPRFVGVQGYFESESELEIEKSLLKEGIISFEGLVNVDKLPKNKEFIFYGVPLKIKSGDGSPVRAFVEID